MNSNSLPIGEKSPVSGKSAVLTGCKMDNEGDFDNHKSQNGRVWKFPSIIVNIVNSQSWDYENHFDLYTLSMILYLAS